VTNAVHGFVAMVINLVRDHRPSALAVAFDLEAGRSVTTWARLQGRAAATPEDLPPQFEMIRKVLDSLAIPVLGKVGFEATMCSPPSHRARDRDCDVVVVTGIGTASSWSRTPCPGALQPPGVSDYALYDEAGILERTGVRPPVYRCSPPFAATRPTTCQASGRGEKTAAKLLNTYGDLDGIYANLDALTPKLRENLAANENLARANAAVIPLVRDVRSRRRSRASTSGMGLHDGTRPVRRARATHALAEDGGPP